MYSLQLQGSKGGGIEVLGQLFLANEDFRGRVQRQHVAKEIQAVCPGATAVHLEIVQLWQDMQLKAVRRDCKVCQSACIITPSCSCNLQAPVLACFQAACMVLDWASLL